MSDVRWEGSKRGLPVPQNLELSHDEQCALELLPRTRVSSTPGKFGGLGRKRGFFGDEILTGLRFQPSHLLSSEVVSHLTPEINREKN